jgi:hypothetical protein
MSAGLESGAFLRTDICIQLRCEVIDDQRR